MIGIKPCIISPIKKHINKKIDRDLIRALAHYEKIRQSNTTNG